MRWLVLLAAIALPMLLGCALTQYLHSRRGWTGRAFDLTEFTLLSVSILAIMIDLGSFEAVTQASELRAAISSAENHLFRSAAEFTKAYCERADADREQRVELCSSDIDTADRKQLERALLCEKMASARATHAIIRCNELQNRSLRWTQQGLSGQYLDDISNAEQFYADREGAGALASQVGAINELKKRLFDLEGPEARTSSGVADFITKFMITVVISFGIGIGLWRRKIAWRTGPHANHRPPGPDNAR